MAANSQQSPIHTMETRGERMGIVHGWEHFSLTHKQLVKSFHISYLCRHSDSQKNSTLLTGVLFVDPRPCASVVSALIWGTMFILGGEGAAGPVPTPLSPWMPFIFPCTWQEQWEVLQARFPSSRVSTMRRGPQVKRPLNRVLREPGPLGPSTAQ